MKVDDHRPDPLRFLVPALCVLLALVLVLGALHVGEGAPALATWGSPR